MVPVTLQYTATGTVDYSPGAPVYEVDFEPESQIEGEISHKDFIRAVYDIESPYVAVKNLVLHPFTGLSQPDVGKNVFRYALGGSTADDDKGYYVIEYMWECDQSRHGWVDFDDVMAGRRNYPNS